MTEKNKQSKYIENIIRELLFTKNILTFWKDALIAQSAVDKSLQKNMSLINSLYFDQKSKNLTKLNSKAGMPLMKTLRLLRISRKSVSLFLSMSMK